MIIVEAIVEVSTHQRHVPKIGVVQLLLTLQWILKAQEKRGLIHVPPMT